MNRILFFVIITIAFFTGCSYSTNPYADFSVGNMDETSPQTDAAILIGDPQVISVETLINDRMRELDHLSRMIKESKDKDFVPQLRRDLSVIRSMASQLGISFNPAAGAAFERAEDIESIKSEIELVKLRNELNQLKELAASDPKNAALDPKNASPGVPEGITEPSVVKIQEQLDAVIKSAKDKLTALEAASDTKTARGSQITSSPEEHFEDLNAYRARLRQRESEVRLDDTYDINGNTLYRLQFNVAVMPGETKAKYGVLDLEILPQAVTDSEKKLIYQSWLSGLMMRTISPSAEDTEWDRLQSVLLRRGLCRRFILFDSPTSSGSTMDLILFTYPGDDDTLIDMLNPNGMGEKLIRESKMQNFSSMSRPELNSLRDDARRVLTTLNSLAAIEEFLSQLKRMNEYFKNIPPNRSRDSLNTIPTKEWLDELEAHLVKVIESARNVLNILDESEAPENRTQVPEAFLNAFNSSKAYSYQAQPTERVQRLSSLASAANSLQMAMSLAATLPVQGVGVNAGASAARTAVGMVDALERTPLVVGYTNRSKSDQPSIVGGPHFGYVFGPKAILNAKTNTLEYRQIPASYAVYADISVPAWWSSLTLKVRRAWAKNWHGSNKVLSADTHPTEFNVRLRPKDNSDDLLTEFLTKDVLRPNVYNKTKIKWVEPNQVSSCQDTNPFIEFLVRGENLWRNPRAYLRGKRHETLDVLPDMGGIVVSFNMDSLPNRPKAGSTDYLVVWTTFGPSIRYPVRILDEKDGKPCRQTASTIEVLPATNMTRYIDGTSTPDVKVTLKDDLPNAVRDIKVIARLLDKQGEHIVDSEKEPGEFDPGKFYMSAIPVDPPSGWAESSLAGTSLYIGLSYKTTDFGLRHKSWASKRIVYYPKQSWANFKLESTIINDLNNKVSIKLPSRFEEAYPKAVKHAEAFAAKFSGSTTLPIKVTADWKTAPGKVILQLSRGSATQTDVDAFNKAWCKNDLTINIETTSSAGEDFPAGVEGNLQLKRRSTGCE